MATKPPVRAAIVGKLGIGKSTLINQLLEGEVAPTSSRVDAGCTQGCQLYEGINRTIKCRLELIDTEGTFGLRDNFGQITAAIANTLDGEALHTLVCCISVQSITRVDVQILQMLKTCAGLLGEAAMKGGIADKNQQRLAIVWTFCNSVEDELKADQCMTAVKDGIKLVMDSAKIGSAKMKQMEPLNNLLQSGNLTHLKVGMSNGKHNCDEVLLYLKQLSYVGAVDVHVDEWTKDPDAVEDNMTAFDALVKGVLAILPPVLPMALQVVGSATGIGGLTATGAALQANSYIMGQLADLARDQYYQAPVGSTREFLFQKAMDFLDSSSDRSSAAAQIALDLRPMKAFANSGKRWSRL